MTLKEVLKAGRDRLRVAGIDEAQTESEHMLMQLLGLNRADIYLSSDKEVQPEQEKQFFAWIQAREKRIPLAYLLGDVFFHSLKLKVGPGCLIPRPETEKLIEASAAELKGKQSPWLLDLGCGSGAIALALLSEIKDAQAVLVDVSQEALEIARANARELNFEKRAEFILSDLFSRFELPPTGGQSREWKFDLIVSNPPYLTREDMNGLQPELAYEPRLALDGGVDGLDFYRRIIKDAGGYLKPGGCLGFELGAGQAEAVSAEMKRNGYEDLRIYKDHQDIERVVLGRVKG
ncbi:MAG TPA: peptide chain release factor N(5)-glutamine methyltransferase [Candidatus Omnitrophota bacterium]|nr:peptide chain release factor N(5)-glutamine methyltransferase [Candidatus Omnitrophota bacterium]